MSEQDPDEQRRASLESWERSAAGWRRRAPVLARNSAPVSRWLVEAVRPQPGHRLLELACGTGETGLLAAELVTPGGSVLLSDQSEGMLAGARARAQELGITNVEFRVLDAEWIDLPLAAVDGVICRWGYMLMTDPGAALRETRRVLRPGGRLALAVWDALERNPWAAAPGRALGAVGLGAPPAPGAPGPFALAAPGAIGELVAEAGFGSVEVEAIDFAMASGVTLEEFWDTTVDMSLGFRGAVAGLDEEGRGRLRAALEQELAPFTDAQGRLEVPARTLVVGAEA